MPEEIRTIAFDPERVRKARSRGLGQLLERMCRGEPIDTKDLEPWGIEVDKLVMIPWLEE
ncbi:hypothetical protein [Novosphingopyxis sp. YJ-S2-01]|uniref:hypothetical protein n=1 Tax=Novosphingopyxis sp. YJ-S2-01 TaxID=2794021 RepID=UPI0018DCE753|nr:hypothetical protein [Novosphingopyxis sp. YJ-S2-01]MBH9537899.1 hypothetical protein [Novosphingopyxis sp. YJ-S2-01]